MAFLAHPSTLVLCAATPVWGRVRFWGYRVTLELQGFTQGWRHKVRDKIHLRLGAPGPQPSVPSCCLLLALEFVCGNTEYKGVL